jgi:hypothetical protein
VPCVSCKQDDYGSDFSMMNKMVFVIPLLHTSKESYSSTMAKSTGSGSNQKVQSVCTDIYLSRHDPGGCQ